MVVVATRKMNGPRRTASEMLGDFRLVMIGEPSRLLLETWGRFPCFR